MKEPNNIDKLFRDQLGTYSANPKKNLFGAIRSSWLKSKWLSVSEWGWVQLSLLLLITGLATCSIILLPFSKKALPLNKKSRFITMDFPRETSNNIFPESVQIEKEDLISKGNTKNQNYTSHTVTKATNSTESNPVQIKKEKLSVAINNQSEETTIINNLKGETEIAEAITVPNNHSEEPKTEAVAAESQVQKGSITTDIKTAVNKQTNNKTGSKAITPSSNEKSASKKTRKNNPVSPLPEPDSLNNLSSSAEHQQSKNNGDWQWGFEVNFGGGLNNKKISGTTENYEAWIKESERNIFNPSASILLRAQKDALFFKTGLMYQTYGEKIERNINETTIDTVVTTVIGIDTFGFNIYYDPINQDYDTVYYIDIDTVTHTLINIFEEEKVYSLVNRYHYLEVPLMAGYQYSLKNSPFTFEISFGLSAAFLTNPHVAVFSEDMNTMILYEKNTNPFRKTMINGIVSPAVLWKPDENIGLVLRPSWKINMNSVFDEGFFINQKYRSFSILGGIYLNF